MNFVECDVWKVNFGNMKVYMNAKDKGLHWHSRNISKQWLYNQNCRNFKGKL